MAVKFNQYWTVNHSKTREYSDFVIKKYIPGMNSLGIHIVAGWTVLIGGYSEIYLEGITNDLEILERALTNSSYEQLREELQVYVISYKTKVLVSTKRHDCYSTDIKENTVKITQAWDICYDKRSEYDKFVKEKFYPMLEKLSIKVANEWRVLIGEGPSIICECRVENDQLLIKDLKSKNFQKTRVLLKRFINNYESRILTVHICKDIGYKSSYYSVISV